MVKIQHLGAATGPPPWRRTVERDCALGLHVRSSGEQLKCFVGGSVALIHVQCINAAVARCIHPELTGPARRPATGRVALRQPAGLWRAEGAANRRLPDRAGRWRARVRQQSGARTGAGPGPHSGTEPRGGDIRNPCECARIGGISHLWDFAHSNVRNPAIGCAKSHNRNSDLCERARTGGHSAGAGGPGKEAVAAGRGHGTNRYRAEPAGRAGNSCACGG